MRIDIHVHHHLCEDSGTAQVLAKLSEIEGLITTMNTDLETRDAALLAAVTAQTTVIGSAVTLLGGLKTQLDAVRQELEASGVSPEQLATLDGVIASVGGNTDTLAQAVATNTDTPPAT